MKRTVLLMTLAVMLLSAIACSSQQEIDLSEIRVVMLIHNQFNYQEASSTYEFLKNAGATVVIAGMELGPVKPYDYDTSTMTVEALVKDVDSNDFHSVYVPGGYSADSLKNYQEVRDLIANMHDQGKVVSAICLGPVVLGKAGILAQKQVSASNSVEVHSELVAAGAIWAQAGGVVEDGTVVTARGPGDLPQFNATYARAILKAANQ